MKYLLLVNKPLDWTSNDAVQFIKHYFHFKKVGHAGTLDPKATGLLLLAVNEGTSLLHTLIKENKSYFVKLQFHRTSPSFDLDSSEITQYDDERLLSKNEVLDALTYFANLNPYQQVPPAFSAIKINGKKAYELARKNQEVRIEPRDVKINNLTDINFDETKQILSFNVNVSSGFYIRSLVRDLSEYLKVHGLLIELCRTSIDKYLLSDAIDILELKNKKLTEAEKNQLLLQKLV